MINVYSFQDGRIPTDRVALAICFAEGRTETLNRSDAYQLALDLLWALDKQLGIDVPKELVSEDWLKVRLRPVRLPPVCEIPDCGCTGEAHA
jgi:hypothetical protein